MASPGNWFQDPREVSKPSADVSSPVDINATETSTSVLDNPSAIESYREASKQPAVSQDVFSNLETNFEKLELNDNDNQPDTNFESIQAHANPAFEIPPHILKNMTPVKRRSSSSVSDSTSESASPKRESIHQLRKKQQLEYKSLKLRQKQELINEKINEVKRRQLANIESSSQRLSQALEQANMRRESILDEVRDKARVSFERHLQFTTCLMTKDEPTSDNDASSESPILIDGAPQLESRQSLTVNNALKVIQRAVSKSLFVTKLRRYQNTSPLSELLDLSYQENLMRLSPGSDIYNLISDLLNFLQMPDLEGGNDGKSNKYHYKSFKFAFILIADTKEAVENGCHSGMNSNITSPSTNSPVDLQQALNGQSSTIDIHNSISNSLATLLYKVAFNLIFCMHTFFSSSLDVILNQISIERLKLGKLWKHYHFIFDCFKSFHLKNCITIANEVLEIIDKQMALLECENSLDQTNLTSSSKEVIEAVEKAENFVTGIKQNRNSLIQNEKFLSNQAEYRSRSSSPNSYDSSECTSNGWTNIGETPESFCRVIRDSLNPNLVPETPMIKVDSELLAVKFYHDSYDMPIGIEFEDTLFTIPPWIPQLTWRKFWIRKLKDETDLTIKTGKTEACDYQIPTQLRSGFVFSETNSLKKDEFEQNEVNDLNSLGASNLAGKYEGITFNNLISHFDEIARGVFIYLFQFAITFTAELQNEEIMYMVSEYLLKLTEAVDQIDPDSYEEVIQYFIIHLSALADVVQEAQISWAKIDKIMELQFYLVGIMEGNWCLDEFGRPCPMIENKDAFIDKITSIYYDIELSLFKKWYNHCAFKTPSDFITFENLLTFTSDQCFKVEMGLNSPELRFPALYQFLYQNSPRVYWSSSGQSYGVDYKSVVSACNNIPKFSSSEAPEYRTESYQFLKESIVHFILKDPDMDPHIKVEEEGIRENEFLHLFESQIIDVSLRMKNVIMASLLICHLDTYDKANGKKAYRGPLNYQEIAHKVLTSLANLEYVSGSPPVICLEIENTLGAENFENSDVIKYLSEKVTSSTNPIRAALFKILSKNLNSGSLDYVEANFPLLSFEVRQIHLEIIRIVDTVYRVYHPLVNWIYDDFGCL